MDDAKLGALFQLIETLYETVASADAWESVLAQLCIVLVCESALIRFYTWDWSRVTLSVTYGFDPRYDDSYRAHFVKIDPIINALRRFTPSRVEFLERLIDFGCLKKTEFYNDYLRPQDKRHIMGGHLYDANGGRAIFGVQRGHTAQAFDDADRRTLQIITPHLVQAFRVHQMLEQANTDRRAESLFFETIDTAVFYFDCDGCIQSHNAAAQHILDCGHVLKIHEGRLTPFNQKSSLQLQLQIQAVYQNRARNHVVLGGATELIPNTLQSPPLMAVVVPYKPSVKIHNLCDSNIVGAVFVGHQGRPKLPEEYLARAYGLSRMEARLVSKLISTCDLSQVADELGIQRQTAKTYLKSIFRKLGCRSQTELVANILSSPLAIWTRER